MEENIELYTRDEVAELLRVSRGFLDHAALRGDGPPFFKIGNAIRYNKAVVVAWLKAKASVNKAVEGEIIGKNASLVNTKETDYE